MSTKPASSVAPVQSMVIRLRERVENAEDWASGEQHRAVARELCNLSECCNSDDIYIDSVGLLVEQLDELVKLSRELWRSRRNMAYGPNAERLMLEQYPWLRADG